MPTQVLGTAVWQGMKITADAMTPVPFLIYNGTTMQTVNPPKNVSFHLMVLLNDAQTNVVIPYASVWGTITEGSKTPFDESLWPMISRYMGPHYGNDVALPGAGTYKLSLLVSPPVSARHLEYQDVWLKPHTVTFTFRWKPAVVTARGRAPAAARAADPAPPAARRRGRGWAGVAAGAGMPGPRDALRGARHRPPAVPDVPLGAQPAGLPARQHAWDGVPRGRRATATR